MNEFVRGKEKFRVKMNTLRDTKGQNRTVESHERRKKRSEEIEEMLELIAKSE